MPKVEYPLMKVAEIPDEGSVLVDFFGRTLHVVRDDSGQPRVFMNVCMHFGGTLVCADGEFRCDWHGATFASASGERTGGPAAQGTRLMQLPAEVRDGVLTYVFAWGQDED